MKLICLTLVLVLNTALNGKTEIRQNAVRSTLYFFIIRLIPILFVFSDYAVIRPKTQAPTPRPTTARNVIVGYPEYVDGFEINNNEEVNRPGFEVKPFGNIPLPPSNIDPPMPGTKFGESGLHYDDVVRKGSPAIKCSGTLVPVCTCVNRAWLFLLLVTW